MKVLIIDDEKAICNTLKEILEYEKYEVDIANDGAEGVKKVQSANFDLVSMRYQDAKDGRTRSTSKNSGDKSRVACCYDFRSRYD